MTPAERDTYMSLTISMYVALFVGVMLALAREWSAATVFLAAAWAAVVARFVMRKGVQGR